MKIKVTITPEPFTTEIDVSWMIEQGKSQSEIQEYALEVGKERYADRCRDGDYPDLQGKKALVALDSEEGSSNA